jgi:stearoyl-CoA desaturase (delta-9 desaturase)
MLSIEAEMGLKSQTKDSGFAQTLALTVLRWFDGWAGMEQISADAPQKVDWIRCIPFIVVHVACFGVIWVGWSWTAVGLAAALYLVRMFAITGFYHRYFSHRTFKTSRVGQFIFAILGASSAQRGPLWWASHHRLHHRRSDEPEDVHSPVRHGFLWSHIGWITSQTNFRVHFKAIQDLYRYRELRLLDRFDTAVPITLSVALYLLGAILHKHAPALGTSGGQLVIWGFFISTVVLMHATFTINSLSHKFGRRRYQTNDDSRNNWFLALLTLGEGWHNNHHHYPASTSQGFYWWEFDFTYYGLIALKWLGVIWDLRKVPAAVLDQERLDAEAA